MTVTLIELPIKATDDAAALLAAVLRRLDAVLIEEPKTGKVFLKLIRYDYEDSTSPEAEPMALGPLNRH